MIVPIPGDAESGITASRKSGPAVVISSGRVRPAPSCTDMRTPPSVGTGVVENSETFVRLNVSTRNTLPLATVPRTRLAPFRIALGNITGGPKSNCAGAAKLPALSDIFQQIRVGKSLVRTTGGIEIWSP